MFTSDLPNAVRVFALGRPGLLVLPLLVFGISLLSTLYYGLKHHETDRLCGQYAALLETICQLDTCVDSLQAYADKGSEPGADRQELLARFERLGRQTAQALEISSVPDPPGARPGSSTLLPELAVYLATVRAGLERSSALGDAIDLHDLQRIRQELVRYRERLFEWSRSLRPAGPAEQAGGRGDIRLPAAVLLSGLVLLALYGAQLRNTLRVAVALARESQQLHRDKRALSYQASHDALTGLLNRTAFEQRFQQVFAGAQGEPTGGALLYLDLDRFKAVNDSCGHLAGDQLLRQIARLLRSQLRKQDILARLGGDEFAILLEQCAPAGALRVAQSIQDAVGTFRFTWQDKTFGVGVSIGIAPIDASSDSTTAVLMAADQACYTAKTGGHSRIHVQHFPSPERHDEPLRWLERIQRSLEDGRLHLYRQTIAPLSPQQAGEYFEILLRLEDEQGHLQRPDAFFAVAERYHLMTALDRWVVERTLAWLAGHPARLPATALCSINLSAASLEDPDFAGHLAAWLAQTRVPPHKLCFEINEAAVLANPLQATEGMERIHTLGCRLALDSFGAGLVHFVCLKRLPADFIKIHGELVADILKDPVDQTLVTALKDIGHRLGKRAIAKSVEAPIIQEQLAHLGVDFAQGYGIAYPRPLDEAGSAGRPLKPASE